MGERAVWDCQALLQTTEDCLEVERNVILYLHYKDSIDYSYSGDSYYALLCTEVCETATKGYLWNNLHPGFTGTFRLPSDGTNTLIPWSPLTDVQQWR